MTLAVSTRALLKQGSLRIPGLGPGILLFFPQDEIISPGKVPNIDIFDLISIFTYVYLKISLLYLIN